jgi:predicted Zn finger-like uncharacterized protein
MFTVCPKCALTLVVTAADLRVAQGYVRCGRCSNVFNALSRLSEDRQAGTQPGTSTPTNAGATVQPQPAPQPAPPPAPKPAAPSAPSALQRLDATARSRALQTPAPPAPEPMRYGDDTEIPEEDLEFNPDATDINKVFVEPPPSPKFTAATGTFQAIRMEAEDAARVEEELARTDEREIPEEEEEEDTFDPVDTQVDVEIDPDLLATMAHLTDNRSERPNPTPESEFSSAVFGKPEPAAPLPPPKPTNSTSATGTLKALQAPKAPAPTPPKPLLLQPSMEQPPQPQQPMRLAERAKARAEAARTGVEPAKTVEAKAKSDSRQKADTKAEPPRPAAAFSPDDTRGTPSETAAALRDVLAPRKRSSYAVDALSEDQPTPFFAGMWTAGSAILLLMLLIQIVHHYRHDLAANATFNGPLTSIYAVLGIPIVPRWDLTAYEVRQLGASTAADAPGQITVRASVKNGARQAQPLPLLRVTLQDRFGNRIASRDVPPNSYLPRAIPSSSLLSAGQRIDAEIAFVDPGSNAVGFEIDACLPAPGGGISCANDLAR